MKSYYSRPLTNITQYYLTLAATYSMSLLFLMLFRMVLSCSAASGARCGGRGCSSEAETWSC
jgi:hypothetical protein